VHRFRVNAESVHRGSDLAHHPPNKCRSIGNFGG
jgi:hypothetical protein